MWSVWTKAKAYHKLPSEIADPRERWDDLTRYQFDNAVTLFGTTIENALHETVEVSVYVQGRRQTSHKPKYTLAQLLDDSFKLPAPQPARPAEPVNPWEPLLALAGQPRSGVKKWTYVAPEAPQEV